MIFQLLQIGSVAFLKAAVREALRLGAVVPRLDKVPRDIYPQDIGSEPRLWQCGRSIAAPEIQYLLPFRDSKPLDERLPTLPHTLCDTSKAPFSHNA
jgi:hypothetical protein